MRKVAQRNGKGYGVNVGDKMSGQTKIVFLRMFPKERFIDKAK